MVEHVNTVNMNQNAMDFSTAVVDTKRLQKTEF